MELIKFPTCICIRGHLASIGQLVAEEAQRPAIQQGDLLTTSWLD